MFQSEKLCVCVCAWMCVCVCVCAYAHVHVCAKKREIYIQFKRMQTRLNYKGQYNCTVVSTSSSEFQWEWFCVFLCILLRTRTQREQWNRCEITEFACYQSPAPIWCTPPQPAVGPDWLEDNALDACTCNFGHPPVESCGMVRSMHVQFWAPTYGISPGRRRQHAQPPEPWVSSTVRQVQIMSEPYSVIRILRKRG